MAFVNQAAQEPKFQLLTLQALPSCYFVSAAFVGLCSKCLLPLIKGYYLGADSLSAFHT